MNNLVLLRFIVTLKQIANQHECVVEVLPKATLTSSYLHTKSS